MDTEQKHKQFTVPSEDEVKKTIEQEQELREAVQKIRLRREYEQTPCEGTIRETEYDPDEMQLTLTINTPTDESFTVELSHTETELTGEMDALLEYLDTMSMHRMQGKQIPLILTESGWNVHLPLYSERRHKIVRWALGHGLLNVEFFGDEGRTDQRAVQAQKGNVVSIGMIALSILLSLTVHPLFLMLISVQTAAMPPNGFRVRLVSAESTTETDD